MKLLFTADWHIKLGQKNVPTDWQSARYHELTSSIVGIECDCIVIGGDLFDKVPTLAELALFFKLVTYFNKPTYIYSGNHEAGKRGYTWLEKLTDTVSKINSNVRIIDGNTDDLPNIDIIDYKDLKTFVSSDFNNRLLLTHVRGSIPPYVIPEIDLSIFNRWDLILAGDLHDHSATLEDMNKEVNLVYPGSPLSCSFHRNKIVSGVILCDTDSLDWEFIEIKLPQLLRKSITDKKDAIKTEYDHTIYEIEGNIEELSSVSTSNLIDRKIVTSDKEAILKIGGMTIEEELDMYLLKVLNIEDTDSICGVFNDYT